MLATGRDSHPAAVEVREVVRKYGDFAALNGLTVGAPAGTIFGVLGPNGCGKSTLLSLLAGDEAPDSGTVTVLGSAPNRALRRRIGVVFQESTLDPLATVGENLELSGRLFGLSRHECRERSEALLSALGLPGRRGSGVTTLSGGMRRRVEIARALLHGPDLLLLDEPTTGIDAEERESTWNHLRGFVEQGGSIILATNDLHEAEGVCTAAAMLYEGRVVGVGTPDALKSGLRRESIVVDWIGEAAEGAVILGAVPGVEAADAEGATIQLSVDDATTIAPRLFAAADGRIAGLRIRLATLEDAYFQHVARQPGRATRRPEGGKQ